MTHDEPVPELVCKTSYSSEDRWLAIWRDVDGYELVAGYDRKRLSLALFASEEAAREAHRVIYAKLAMGL